MITVSQKIKESVADSIAFFRDVSNSYDLIYSEGTNKDSFLKKLDEIEGSLITKNPVTIAFIGEYNAGKTSLINLLSENKFEVSSNVSTQKSAIIKWGEYLIVDTPGFGSGNEDHDEETKKWLEKADLLVYVLTPDLLTKDAGERFRTIIQSYSREHEMQIVVNRVDQDDNEVETYKVAIQEILGSQPIDDFNLHFTSAAWFQESMDETLDDEEKKFWVEKSGFKTFFDELDHFITARKEKAVLSSPLIQLFECTALIAPKSEYQKEHLYLDNKISLYQKGIESLKREKRKFSDRLKVQVERQIGELYSYMDNPDKNLEEKIDASLDKSQTVLEETASEFLSSLNILLGELEAKGEKMDSEQLEDIVFIMNDASDIHKEIFADLFLFSDKIPVSDTSASGNKIEAIGFTDGKEWEMATEQYIHQMDQLLPGELHKLNIFQELHGNKLTGALHNITAKVDRDLVYNVGKKVFKVNFKPWGAVNLAKNIQTGAAKVIPFVSLGISLFEFYKDNKKKNQQKKFEESVRESKKQIRESLEASAKELYDIIIENNVQPFYQNIEQLEKKYLDKKHALIFGLESEQKNLFEKIDEQKIILRGCLDELYSA